MFADLVPLKYDGCLTTCKGQSKFGVVIDMVSGLLHGICLVALTNYYWQGTLLMRLYEYYMEQSDEDDSYSVTQAGRAAGHLLKRVLIEDPKRRYETLQRYNREYRWVGEEMLG